MVSSEINKTGPYACNGATTEFSFPYKIFAVTDLKVYLRDTDDVLTLLTYTTHYSIASINGQNYNDGVTATTVATYGTGNTITLLRVVPLTQGADYVENDDFPAEGHESALDRGVMISQQLNEALDRIMQAPIDEENVDMTIPSVAERKGKYLFFDLTYGEPVGVGLGDGSTLSVTDFAKTLLDDATSIEALGTLGIPTELQGMSAFIKTLLNDASALIARGTLDVDQASKLVAKVADYAITDTDGVKVIDMTTGAPDRTATLPTAADNPDREITLRKADSGAGYAILDGEGAETINGTTTWEVTEQYGYVTVKSNGTAWIVLAQEGCVYEMWNSTNYVLTTSWVDYYNLSGISPGKYLIEYGIKLVNSTEETPATLATTVDTEDDPKYTVAVQMAYAFVAKSFIRSFAASTTLYLNAKESAGDGNIKNGDGYGYGYIRATRIG